ncbi:MAG: heme exporter protein CcmD [Pseudorhodobacter sp.]|nr:MAG: heme exporter protein CcmD [Pseudorhodobacter sp.]
MIPDLGKYAGAVMWSYLASLALIFGFVALSVWQSRRMKRALDDVEARQGKAHE